MNKCLKWARIEWQMFDNEHFLKKRLFIFLLFRSTQYLRRMQEFFHFTKLDAANKKLLIFLTILSFLFEKKIKKTKQEKNYHSN